MSAIDLRQGQWSEANPRCAVVPCRAPTGLYVPYFDPRIVEVPFREAYRGARTYEGENPADASALDTGVRRPRTIRSWLGRHPSHIVVCSAGCHRITRQLLVLQNALHSTTTPLDDAGMINADGVIRGAP